MKKPPINCPRCNSLQKFGFRRRQVGFDKHEVFIKCSDCRWEYVVISGSGDKISLQRDITRLKERVKKDPQLKQVLYERLMAYRQSDS